MNSIVKFLLISLGTISVGLGVVGIVIPLLPTTPLLLLGAACYVRSSETLYKKLLANKWLGGYIEDFQTKKGISKKNKIISLTTIWLSMGISIIFASPHLWVSFILVIIGALISALILSFKTL